LKGRRKSASENLFTICVLLARLRCSKHRNLFSYF